MITKLLVATYYINVLMLNALQLKITHYLNIWHAKKINDNDKYM